MLRPVLLSAALLSAALAVLTAPIAAAGPGDDVVSLEVLPGWRTEAGTHMAGLRFSLAPGWKTYWRAPGDSGIPPTFTWQGSRNMAGARFHWPVPEVFWSNGLRSIGYSGDVVIPVEITPARPGAAARIAGQVDLGVCATVCVPVTLDFAADLPAAGERDVAIATALVDRPLTEAEAGVGRVACAVAPSDEGLRVTAAIEMPPAGGAEVAVIETGDPGIWVSEAETRREGGILTASVEMIHGRGGAVALDRSALRITVLGSDRAVEIDGCSG